MVGRAKLMGLCMAASVAIVPVGASAAGTPEATVERALASYDMHGAAVALNELIAARLPAKEAGRPDPVLDRLLVQLLSISGQASAATPILERMLKVSNDAGADHARLLLATAYESNGAFDEAGRFYRGVTGAPAASAADRASAAIGLARVQLSSDPAAASVTLGAMDRATLPKDRAWEADLLTSRAAFMQSGNDAAGRASLDHAWLEAADASLPDAAVPRIATDRATLAGRTGDRQALVTMLAVDRGARSPNQYQPLLAADLPVCGANGLTPQDMVVVTVAHQTAAAHPRTELIWASRPGIARAFLVAVSGGAPQVPDGRVAAFGLRCRTAPSMDYAVRNTLDERIIAWMTGLGAYPLSNTGDGSDTVSLASALAQRQARYGDTSIMLLPILMRITGDSLPALAGDDDARRRALDYVTHVQRIMDANHAPTDLIVLIKLSALGVAVASHAKTEAQGQSEAEALAAQAATDPAVSLDMLFWLASGLAQAPNTPTGFKMTILASALDVFARRAPASDPRAVAIALRLHKVRKEAGDDAGAAQAIARFNLAPDLCALADPPTHYVSSAIASDDYPGDLIFSDIRGSTRVEFGLDASGAAQKGRLLVTDPAYAFDAIATARIPTIHYDPPRSGGKVSSCRTA